MGKKTKRTAKEMFAIRDSRNQKPPPPKEVLDLIREVVEENDGRNARTRIGAETMAEVITEDYGLAIGKDALNRICKDHLGRKSWAHA